MPKKLDRCVKAVKKQGKSEDSAYAICSDSTGIKRKKGGGWTKKALRELIRESINEVMSEQHKLGYVVAGEDQTNRSYKQGDVEFGNLYPIESFPFSKYPEHKALESAIELAQQHKANVYTMRPNGSMGDKVWPQETNLNESEEDLVSLLKGQDYSTISGLSYHLKECGCDTTMGYNDGNHRLMVKREFLPLAIDSLANTCDNLGQTLAEKLQKKYFKK